MINWHNANTLMWLLALLPMLFITRLLIRQRIKLLQHLTSPSLWPTMLPEFSLRRQHAKTLLRLLALAWAIAALARPQWGARWEKVEQQGMSVIVALDTSKSMLTQDIKPNRLQQAQWGVRDLVKELRGDRIGLVAFAGEAFLQCPVTADYAAFLMVLDDIHAGIVPVGGTDLFQALETSLESFEKSKENRSDRAIILISDGEGHTGDPLTLLPKLKREEVRVFAIGVGTKEGELIQTVEGFVKDQDGNVVKSTLNEQLLEHIAFETGGFYVRAAPGDFGLEHIYRQGLAKLRREKHESRMSKIWTERFQWFLAAALLLLVVEACIQNRNRKNNPWMFLTNRMGRGKRVAGWWIVAILWLLTVAAARAEDTPRSSMYKGLKAYRKGDYTNAVKHLEKTVLEFPALGNYNLGNALYRTEKYEAAAESYNEALHTSEIELQAKALFNRGNALLARIMNLVGEEEIALAIKLAFQAADMFEKAILLFPGDMEAKRNFEHALQLCLRLEYNLGKRLFDRAESLLAQYKAKEAKDNYLEAKKRFMHVLENVELNHRESVRYIPKIEKRLEMLALAVETAEKDLITALRLIGDYQYILAAQRLATESDERKYAFDLKPDVKIKYEETIRKNGEVLKIIEELFSEINTL